MSVYCWFLCIFAHFLFVVVVWLSVLCAVFFSFFVYFRILVLLILCVNISAVGVLIFRTYYRYLSRSKSNGGCVWGSVIFVCQITHKLWTDFRNFCAGEMIIMCLCAFHEPLKFNIALAIHMIMQLRSGHVTLLQTKFQPLNCPPIKLTAPGGLTLGSAPYF